MLLIWRLLASQGLPGRPGSPYYMQNAFDLVAFGLWGSPVDPGPLTICKMLLIWWLLALRGLPCRPGSPYYKSTRAPLLYVKCF